MEIPDGLITPVYAWISGFLYASLLLFALLTAPWSKIRDNEAQHVFLGTIFMVSVLWRMQGGIQPGLDIHLLCITTICLMFEWQFALFAASIIVAVSTLLGPAGWSAYTLNIVFTGVIPIAFTRAFLYLCQRTLPHNYFIYVFLNAFLAGAISILLAGLASAGIQHLAEAHPPGIILENFVYILPLIMFGEAFINGGAMTLLVTYRPHWVATFHDRWYLDGK